MAKWYSAQILYRSIIDRAPKSDDEVTYEESIVLLEATSKEQAFEMAEENR